MKRQAGRRRIIERPRLTQLLDGSPARIKMLVAPAGYGKTTLARQWLSVPGRPHAWLSCRPSSADVAALAEEIVAAVQPIVPGFGEVVLQRLSATGNPAHELDVLAEIMREDFERWPHAAWLALDDCHELAHSAAAELFLGELAAAPALNLLLLGRRRPAWATARRVVYGEILDVGRAALAMTDTEAQELLDPADASVLLGRHTGSGWPALLGLAALAGELPPGDEPVPASVYDFLAEELFATLSGTAREVALAIVAMPRMDRETARELFGPDAGPALAEAAAAGMIDLSEQSGTIEMYPLIRDFLLTKRDAAADASAERLFRILLDEERWDDAFAVVAEFFPEGLEELLQAALPQLLAKSRVQTLETWLTLADEQGLEGVPYEHALAELAFREGSHIEAFTAAQSLARRLPDGDETKTLVLLLAGRAAHLASLEHESLDAYRASKELAHDQATRRIAMWGEIGAAIDLELPTAETLLADAEAECDTFVDVVNHATQSLMHDARRGEIRSLDRAWALLPSSRRVADPVLRCSFLNGLSSTLAIVGEYARCRAVSGALLSEAQKSRLEFVIPYALAAQAMASAGLKAPDDAIRALDSAIAAARDQQDKHSMLNCQAIYSRIHFAAGDFVAAFEALPIDVTGAIPSMAAEINACRALALAALGRTDEALVVARRAAELSSSIETRVLVAGTHAVSACMVDPPGAADAVRRLVATARSSGNLDALVTIYRGYPDILGSAPEDVVDELAAVLRKVGDLDLVEVLQRVGGARRKLTDRLSPRELEVARLMVQGMTNPEIGARLFISPDTAKTHVRRILKKLGARTRTEAALRFAALAGGRTEPGPSSAADAPRR